MPRCRCCGYHAPLSCDFVLCEACCREHVYNCNYCSHKKKKESDSRQNKFVLKYQRDNKKSVRNFLSALSVVEEMHLSKEEKKEIFLKDHLIEYQIHEEINEDEKISGDDNEEVQKITTKEEKIQKPENLLMLKHYFEKVYKTASFEPKSEIFDEKVIIQEYKHIFEDEIDEYILEDSKIQTKYETASYLFGGNCSSEQKSILNSLTNSMLEPVEIKETCDSFEVNMRSSFGLCIIEEPVIFGCKHVFCKKELPGMFKRMIEKNKFTCPFCDREITKINMFELMRRYIIIKKNKIEEIIKKNFNCILSVRVFFGIVSIRIKGSKEIEKIDEDEDENEAKNTIIPKEKTLITSIDAIEID